MCEAAEPYKPSEKPCPVVSYETIHFHVLFYTSS